MTGKRRNVVDDYGFIGLKRRLAYAASAGDDDTRRLSLEGAEDQFSVALDVETDPTHVGESLEQQGGSVR